MSWIYAILNQAFLAAPVILFQHFLETVLQWAGNHPFPVPIPTL